MKVIEMSELNDLDGWISSFGIIVYIKARLPSAYVIIDSIGAWSSGSSIII